MTGRRIRVCRSVCVCVPHPSLFGRVCVTRVCRRVRRSSAVPTLVSAPPSASLRPSQSSIQATASQSIRLALLANNNPRHSFSHPGPHSESLVLSLSFRVITPSRPFQVILFGHSFRVAAGGRDGAARRARRAALAARRPHRRPPRPPRRPPRSTEREGGGGRGVRMGS